MPVELRDHQVEAVDAIMRGLDIPPGGKIPPHGLRAGACRVRDRQDDHGLDWR